MARIIVMADAAPLRSRGAGEDLESVLLDEHVRSIHLRDGHSAEQLVQRLAWAVDDAERAERRSTVGSRPRPMAVSG